MLKRSDVKRAARCARGGSGIVHTTPHASHRSSMVSVVGKTGRTTREAHVGQVRHCDSVGLGRRGIGDDFQLLG
jgi:hypothetical protein